MKPHPDLTPWRGVRKESEEGRRGGRKERGKEGEGEGRRGERKERERNERGKEGDGGMVVAYVHSTTIRKTGEQCIYTRNMR